MNDLSKDAVNRLAVDEAGAGQRIDNFLLRMLKGVPKSHIYRILRSGEVRLNRKRAKPDTRLAVGDELRIPPIRTASGSEQRRLPPIVGPAIPILYEDDAMIALDKPPGIAVHGGSGVSFGVIEQIRNQRPDARFLELVHRLDRDTSGILLLAKTRPALLAMHAAMRRGEVDKRYLVMVRGKWRDAKRVVDLRLEKYLMRTGERRVRVEEDAGMTARTVFHSRQIWPQAMPPMSLLEAELHTGRTHQIRVHLSHLGFPLAGDDKYGDFPLNRTLSRDGLRRIFLHAHRLRIAHPVDQSARVFESPLPPDLQRYLEHLNAGSTHAT